MLQEISTKHAVPPLRINFNLYTSQPYEDELQINMPFRKKLGRSFLQMIEGEYTAPSVDFDLQTADIANETVTTFHPLFEERSADPRISFRNDEAVREFLTRHPEIQEFLETVWPDLVKCFGRTVGIVLEVLSYPEDGAYDELVGWIQSYETVKDGLENLEKFENEWLEEQLDWVGNKFNFNIEFK